MTKQKAVIGIILVLALAHLIILGLAPHPILLSNILQVVTPLLLTLLCLHKAQSFSAIPLRRAWIEVSIGFLIWTTSQVFYTWSLLSAGQAGHLRQLSDIFGVAYTLPLLFVASRGHEQRYSDWTKRLDFLQMLLSVALVYTILLIVQIVNVDLYVYAIQGIALLFACSIRYACASTEAESSFFLVLGLYALTFNSLGLAARVAQLYGRPVDGSLFDLAWTLPFLLYSLLTVYTPQSLLNLQRRVVFFPAHLHGISALGLAATSMISGIFLSSRHPFLGMTGVLFSCFLFALRTATRESQLKRAQTQLEFDSLHDSLTGLVNRRFLIRELDFAQGASLGKRSLLLLDLDRFKVINDSLGHTFGDQLLLHVSKLLRYAVSPGDIVTRLGGDEFVILINENNRRDLNTIQTAELILRSLRSPIQLEGRVVHITASIGIVAVDERKTAVELLRDVDAAMYRAKASGKDRYHIFDDSILERTTRELDIEDKLRGSMKDGTILVAYQPIYSLKTKQLEGFEALARWPQFKDECIGPEEFIPLAEDTGLIIELGKQILERACYQVAQWNRDLQSRLTLNVNVSARQFADHTFLSFLKEVLKKSSLEPTLLKLEITESVLLQEHHLAGGILVQARAMGIEICLDDFGTGYSSLSYLLNFPFDTIKIDKSFVQDVEQDQRRAEMMRTIQQLAQNLKKKVIAEGIETTAQLDFLIELNCDAAQGFLLSKPLMPEGITELLHSSPASLPAVC